MRKIALIALMLVSAVLASDALRFSCSVASRNGSFEQSFKGSYYDGLLFGKIHKKQSRLAAKCDTVKSTVVSAKLLNPADGNPLVESAAEGEMGVLAQDSICTEYADYKVKMRVSEDTLAIARKGTDDCLLFAPVTKPAAEKPAAEKPAADKPAAAK